MKKQLLAGFLILALLIAGMFTIECYDRYIHFRSGDLKFMCEHTDFGIDDDHYPLIFLKAIHLIHDVDITCTPTSHLFKEYLSSAGIESRKVMLLTTRPWNLYNNGHTILEIYEENKWHVYDVSKDVYFTSENGTQLSFIELYSRIHTGNYEIQSITGKDFNETAMRQDLEYVGDIPYIILDVGNVFFVPEGNYDDKELKYFKNPVIILPKNLFMEIFYGDYVPEEVFCDVF